MAKKKTKQIEPMTVPIDGSVPCPKCRGVKIERWYDSEKGEEMKGCQACRYTSRVDQWDAEAAPSIKPEETNLAESPRMVVLFSPKELADLLHNSAFLTEDQANTIAADLYQPLVMKLGNIERALRILCGSCDLSQNIKNSALDALRGDE